MKTQNNTTPAQLSFTEEKVMVNIITSELLQVPVTTATDNGKKSLIGALAGLVKKGYAVKNTLPDGLETVDITTVGFDTYSALLEERKAAVDAPVEVEMLPTTTTKKKAGKKTVATDTAEPAKEESATDGEPINMAAFSNEDGTPIPAPIPAPVLSDEEKLLAKKLARRARRAARKLKKGITPSEPRTEGPTPLKIKKIIAKKVGKMLATVTALTLHGSASIYFEGIDQKMFETAVTEMPGYTGYRDVTGPVLTLSNNFKLALILRGERL